jgi:anti-sigma factor (TIGR02949 family)
MTSEPLDQQACGSVPDAGSAVGDCEEAVRQLYAFLDGELTDELRHAFEAHLDACNPCVEVVAFEAELRKVIANKCQDRVPEELRERITAAIFNEAKNRK